MKYGSTRHVWTAIALVAAVLWLSTCGAEPATAPAVPAAATAAIVGPSPQSRPATATIKSSQSPPAASPAPATRPSALRGQPLYAANCAGCHGAGGDGSGLAGAANFTDPQLTGSKSPAQFYLAVRDGAPGSAMPAWDDRLGETEMWDVVTYARSFLTTPEQIAAGLVLFQTECAACHGAAGDGSGLPGAANLTDPAFMSAKTHQAFVDAISNGRGGSAMPAFGDRLSQDQIWTLANSVWSFAYDLSAAPPTEGPAVAPTAITELLPPTASLLPAPTTAPTQPASPDPAAGRALWAQKPCLGCHGANAEGGIGPRLAGTSLLFDEVLLRVRTGKAPMPAFAADQISDQELKNIVAWFQSLAQPAPTPAPTQAGRPALPPSTHLLAFWEQVNRVKVHSDYAKDASPDIGALHSRANQVVAEANGALHEADLAIADIPNPAVQATIRQVKVLMTGILSHAGAALATENLDGARAEAAKMVEISRLESLPLATLAVKQAGFTGTVRVQVKDSKGRPIRGALVTTLTAPTPSAGITDGNGRVTIVDLAAVRLMQVKAYQAGVVYHEVNVTVPTGGRADAAITLPGANVAGQAPVAANARITPSSGAGSAQVTFSMTTTDPQGHLNIAEDQVFALNPVLGLAYVLRSAGGDEWQLTQALPDLKSGTHTWYFFVVDHQCNTSNILPIAYSVP